MNQPRPSDDDVVDPGVLRPSIAHCADIAAGIGRRWLIDKFLLGHRNASTDVLPDED